MRTAVICSRSLPLPDDREDVEMSREETAMSLVAFVTFVLILVISVSAHAPVTSANSQTSPAALTGIVSSEAEGPMEGVLVSAKPAGGSISVTVVSDTQGDRK